ncbi:hypothetical protein XENORESO_013536 [Xenotaenia resolanae]|uniref:Uncharacterized protein n=1 Tax=Xenotaenia resolanae TaxID=208358 RepID=A0ABV0WWR8_9TELE
MIHTDVSESSDDEMSVNREEQITESTEQDERNVRQTNETNVETEGDVTNIQDSTYIKLRTGQTVTFTNRDDGTQHTARFLGRAGKGKGRYKNWYNGSEGQKTSIRHVTG